MNILNMLKNIFKVAKLLSVDDSGDFQFATVSFSGKQQKVLMLKPYGLMSNPPVSSMVGLWSQQGQESNGIGIADDPKNRTLKDLEPGEVGLSNFSTGDYIFFDKDGNMSLIVSTNKTETITGNSIENIGGFKQLNAIGSFGVSSTFVNLNGTGDNLTMWSDLNTQLQALITSFNIHTHNSGLVPDTPLSLNITGARANTLRTDG